MIATYPLEKAGEAYARMIRNFYAAHTLGTPISLKLRRKLP